MISVIIPTLNEEKTIGLVIGRLKKDPLAGEIIVVDDKSLDNTLSKAKEAGADVMTSTRLGKGASMRDGLLRAKGDVIVYLDGDIPEYDNQIIRLLTDPITSGNADFVKATFSREAGRVTELVAKPLISLLFPKLGNFSQPLSGMIAGRKDFFTKVRFENDYGVDIGILIDMHLSGARISQVEIGHIQNKSKPWYELTKMSRDVTRAILKRADISANANLETLGSMNLIRDQMTFSIKKSLSGMKKMVIFDMDKTLLEERFIEVAARELNFSGSLFHHLDTASERYVRTKEIALFFRGTDIGKILEIADGIDIIRDTIEVIDKLKRRGYIVGIISDSYDCVANHIMNKINADFALANELEFSDSIATGEVKIPSFFLKSPRSVCSHGVCKSNALHHVADSYGIRYKNVIAVGDGENDICMLKAAGVGVAFCSGSDILKLIADKRIDSKTFRPLLHFAN
jgi:glucosyl-3-phosphoglycerate synthase